MEKERHKIESFHDILGRFKLPRFDSVADFFNVMVKSSKESKVNCLLQSINVILVVAIIYVILPNRFDQWFTFFENFEWLFLPMGRIATTFISYFIFKSASWIFNFSLSDLFTTVLAVSISITIGLAIFVFILFNKMLISFLGRIRKDLLL